MGNRSNRWTVKTAEGKVFGPYTKSILYSLIKKGALSGTEMLAIYPGGEYLPISQAPDFYDQFLMAWEAEVEPLSEERKVEELDSATSVDQSKSGDFLVAESLTKASSKQENATKPLELDASSDEIVADKSDIKNSQIEIQKIPAQKENARSISFVDDVSLSHNTSTWTSEEQSGHGQVIAKASVSEDAEEPSFSIQQSRERTQPGIASPKKKEYVREDRKPSRATRQGDPKFKILVTIIALVLGALLYEPHPAETIRKQESLSLQTIQATKKIEKKLSRQEWAKIRSAALRSFEQDSFASYRQTMQQLVEAIERHGPDVDSIGLLCSTYRELWPYTEQTVRDLSAISKANQLVSGMNVGGMASSNCRAIQFILAGNLRSAEQVLQTALQQFPTAATFYEMRAELFSLNAQWDMALSFLQKTQELWGAWKKPQFLIANLYKKQAQYEIAESVYQSLLNKNNFHALAAIERAELLVSRQQHYPQAKDLIVKATDANNPLPRAWRSKAFYVLAVITNHEGDRPRALEYIKKSYEWDSKNELARSYLIRLGGEQVLSGLQRTEIELIENGDQMFAQQNFLAAQAEYRAAFELNDKNERAGIRAAESLWELNQADEAIRWLTNVIMKNPKSIEALLLQAKYQTDRYRFAEAAKNLMAAKNLSRSDYRLLRTYAMYELARKNFSAAKDFAEKAIALYDTDIDSHIVLAEAFRNLSALDQAYKIIARAVSLEPLHVQAQSSYAEILAEFQGATAGVQYITNLINTYPTEMKYRLALAEIYYRNNQSEQAKATLLPITRVRADYKPAFLALAKIYVAEQKPQEALEAYLSAASLDPTDAQPLVEVGQLYQLTNRLSQALEQYERAIRINPNYPRIHYFIGMVQLEMGRNEDALKSSQQERQKNPMLADSYLLAGDAYRALGNYNQAVEEYRRAIQKRPQSAEIYVKLASCYRLMGNLDVAESMLSTATAKEVGYADIYLESGIILEKRGQWREAVEAYRRYLGLKPNAKNADMVRGKIQSLE